MVALGVGGGRPLGPPRLPRGPPPGPHVCLRVCRAVPDGLAAAPRSCWPSGSCGRSPGACAGGCGRWPCWGSCGCCVWGRHWAAPWPSTPSRSSRSRCGPTADSPHGPGHRVRPLLTSDRSLVTGSPRRHPGCPPTLSLLLTHSSCLFCFAFPDTCVPTPFLCGLTGRPGRVYLGGGWGPRVLLSPGGPSGQPPPARARGWSRPQDGAPAVTPAPPPAEPRVHGAGGGAAGPAHRGVRPQSGRPLPVPLPGGPGAARLPGAGGVRGHLQVRGQAGQVEASWGAASVPRSALSPPRLPVPPTGTSFSRWSFWGFFATTGWGAGWAS